MDVHADLQEADVQQGDKSDRFRAHLIPLLIITSIFFINFIARIIPAPLMPKIEADLNISHAQAGSFFLLISIGYFITLLGSGFFSSRLTHRQTILVSSVALGLALVGVSFSQGLWGIRLGLLILGMSAGLYLSSGITTVTSITGPRHWGKAIGIHELAPNLGFVVAPLVSEVVLIWFSWRTVFVLLGACAILLAFVFARFGRGGEFRGEAPGLSSYGAILSNPLLWVLVVLFSLGISSSHGLFTMLPLFLVTDHGIERNWANTLLALSRIPSVGMTLAGGLITDRVGPQRVLKVVFLFTGLLTILMGLAPTNWIGLAVFAQPTLAACFFPAGIAALSLVSSQKERSLFVSLTVPLAFLIGGGVVPALIGFIGDVGSFATGIVVVGGLVLTGTIFTGYLKIADSVHKG
jgi:NNP family nitrate/nitrite transporter-like MFS transporter